MIPASLHGSSPLAAPPPLIELGSWRSVGAPRRRQLVELAAQDLARVGFELGWDCGRYHGTPPQAVLRFPQALAGFTAARNQFAGRLARAGTFERRWLGLRAGALERGRVIDESVTPDYLRSIAPSHCP